MTLQGTPLYIYSVHCRVLFCTTNIHQCHTHIPYTDNITRHRFKHRVSCKFASVARLRASFSKPVLEACPCRLHWPKYTDPETASVARSHILGQFAPCVLTQTFKMMNGCWVQNYSICRNLNPGSHPWHVTDILHVQFHEQNTLLLSLWTNIVYELFWHFNKLKMR